jgi:flagellar motility protein MotE (MotC chaperone)
MNQDLITFLFVALIALVLGIILSYLFLKSTMVNRNSLDEIKDKYAAAKNELDTKIALEKELRESVTKTVNELQQEREKNKEQEKDIAQLNENLNSLNTRVDEEKETNRKQQEYTENSSREILTLKTELSKVETIKSILE